MSPIEVAPGQDQAHALNNLAACGVLGEAMLPALLEQMFTGAAVCQMLYQDGKPDDLVYLYTNAAFRQQTGLGPVCGKRTSEVVPGIRESDPELLAAYGRVAAGGAPERIEIFVEALAQWFSVQALSLKPGYFLAIFDVISKSKRDEQALMESEVFGQSILDSMISQIAVLDHSGVILAVNEPWRRFALENGLQPGVPAPKTGVGVNYLEICSGGSTDETEVRVNAAWGIRAVIDGVLPTFSLEYPCDSPAQQRWFRMMVTPIGSERPGRVVVTHTEITTRVLNAQRIDGLMREQKAILENDLIGIVTLRNRWIVWANPAFEKMLGYAHGELVGVATRQLYASEEAYEAVGQTAYPLMQAGQVFRSEIELVRKDGVHVWADLSGSGLNLSVGESLWSFVDITERKRSEDKLRQLSIAVEQSPASVVITDLNASIEYVNARFTKVTGYSAAEAIGQNPKILKSGLTSSETYDEMWRRLCSGLPWKGEIVNRRKDGEHYWEDVQIAPVKNPLGVVTHYVAVKSDITDYRKVQEELRRSEARLKLIFNQAPLGIALVDSITGRIYTANPIFARMVGKTMEDVLQMDWRSGAQPHYVQEDRDNMAALIAGKISEFQLETHYVREDGTTTWIHMTIAAVEVKDKAHPRHLCMVEDITKRKQMEEQIRQLAFHDALTNLPNRRLLMDRLTQAMAACKRSEGYGALMFMDLDNFKPLNDQHGHAVGDLLLVEVARRLRACVRAMDTVSRLGGDEFVVLLGDLATDPVDAAEQANKLAEKILVALSRPYLLPGGNEAETIEHHCSASIGVVLFCKEHQDLDNLLKWADAAMYRSKAEGRNRITFMGERRANQRA